MIEIPEFKFALREDIKYEPKFLPSKTEPNATGYDVRAAQKDQKELIIKPFQYFKIPLGFRGLCPTGWWYQLCPRSSSFTKKHMHNLIGIVDCSWEGETLFAGQYIPDPSDQSELIIQFGEKIAQIIPFKLQSMDIEVISNKEYNDFCEKRGWSRKDGGFGSSGN